MLPPEFESVVGTESAATRIQPLELESAATRIQPPELESESVATHIQPPQPESAVGWNQPELVSSSRNSRQSQLELAAG